MQSAPISGQWPGSPGSVSGDEPIMSATSGPIPAHEFYYVSQESSPPSPNGTPLHASSPQPLADAARVASQSPLQKQTQPAPSSFNPNLNSAKSTPVLVSPVLPGSVKNIASQFDQAGAAIGGGKPPPLTVRTSQDRYRRPGVNKSSTHVSPRSPTKDGARKLQKPRPAKPMSPVKSPVTSFDTSTSFSSTATIASSKNQPHTAFAPKKQQLVANTGPYMTSRPLFGEITSDGRWNGNFDLGRYPPLPTFTDPRRRSNDGSIALGHGRSQSHQDILQPALSAPQYQTLSHKRSRSEMDAYQEPKLPPPNAQQERILAMYPTPPNSGTRKPTSPTSRIPVSNRRQSIETGIAAGPHSRSGSALSNPSPGGSRLAKSPTPKAQAIGKENANPPGIPRSRYNPPPASSEPNGQKLSAKIVAPPPKTSPPLRSSRPRQPVSAATTSASRARAAEPFQNSNAPRDLRRPSEQWLGKPYDPQKERSKRKIPELGKINFEERRARIQKAISQNLEESRSLESLRAKSRSRQASREAERRAEAGAENGPQIVVDGGQSEMVCRGRTESMPGGWPTPGGLTVDTFHVPDQAARAAEPTTAWTLPSGGTEFEVDESPILGRPKTQERPPTLLTSAIYQPPPKPTIPPPNLQPPNLQPPDLLSPDSAIQETPASAVLPSPSVLDNVMRMRQRSPGRSSRSGTDYADDSAPASPDDNPSDLEDNWGIGRTLSSVQGSIKIMLDGPWPSNDDDNDQCEQLPDQVYTNEFERTQQDVEHAFTSHDYTESPTGQRDDYPEDMRYDTQRITSRQDRIRASSAQPGMAFPATGEDDGPVGDIARVLKHYKSTGTLTPQMLEHVQRHMVDLQRVSANEGSNGFMIQSLLDSVLNSQQEQRDVQMQEVLAPPSGSFDMDMSIVTPDTPIGWEFSEDSGTAIVYTNEPSSDLSPEEGDDDEEDFHVKIQKADEAWELQQRGEYLRLGVEDNEDTLKPAPPPKDIGYTPRSSTGAESSTLPQEFAQGLRISTVGHLDLPGPFLGDQQSPLSSSAPPQPVYGPPPPPTASASATHLPFGMPEVPPMPATYSERASSEMSPRARKNFWGPSGSSRPSTESQRAPGVPPLPGSVSVTSLAESTIQDSMDTAADSQTKLVQTTSQSPEQKRLLKRRHIIRELLDTENTYHQDLKIIEDIYRATAGPDVISPEDKKILFSNCDDIERFSLQFYDELRKAAAPVYVPAKKGWANNRGSMSTNESDRNGLPPDGVDDDKDRTTTIGQAFLQNLQGMEQVYSIYLKNHDTANRRLSALRNTPTVKCWLDECHNNASDITFAWNLDSLLVKPTQRAAKYPLLLQQLLETTPAGHPDREALSTAAKDCLDILTRINDAKKRADLVDQIVNRKRKESDVRSGIAKAFGRRTEKLKERVGIAEAFQDAEFDELAHKFGGHFIRLQICMRDVQDYMNRIEKAVEQINNYALALDFFADVAVSPIPELESKWRKYGQVVREITSVAFSEHKAAVNKRVIQPMITCINLHDGPQNAINNRKKRIVDYAKCKSIEKRGEKPDKKTVEASDMYVALNDQLKIELPKLYNLTASLVQGCLNCFLDIQLTWYNTWERKLRPVLEAADVPSSIQQIEPAFRPDYDMVKGRLLSLGICNGALLAESANFLSPASTLDEMTPSSGKRPSTLDSSKRTMSVGSEISPVPGSATHKRNSSGYNITGLDALPFPYDGRIRSNSSQSIRGAQGQTAGSANAANRSWLNNADVPMPPSRPATAHQPFTQQSAFAPPRTSADQPRSPRPMSGATYFTARPEQPEDRPFSNIFSSAMPQDSTPDLTRSSSPQGASDDMPILFVCASLFEFSIERTRREAGYPYLTYVQGEVFDVIAQKGELWLAKNQDDPSNTLGWIWEQHFVILSQD